MTTKITSSQISAANAANSECKEVSSSSKYNNVCLEDYKADWSSGKPALYVGTYHKYSCGSIFGAWIDLTACDSYDEFIEVCKALHADEKEPEFMFQDYENMPEIFYHEGIFTREDFEMVKGIASLEDSEREAFEVFINYRGYKECKQKDFVSLYDDFYEAYCGEWSSEEDFAIQFVEDCGMLDNVPDSMKNYFDWAAFSRDLFMCDYYFDSGYCFRCC